MTFKQALNVILKQRGHGNKKSNLAEVKKTAAALGLQKLPFKNIIVAGTNGKGTTATLLALALTSGGYKTGLFTSPHIYEVTERIKIDGANISRKDFAFYVNAVLAKETVPLKFFEVLTLAAMLYFKDSGVDYVVCECGIGGRKDCTNIFPRVLSVITSVDIDHSAILGDTLAKIAWQKGGIIKSGVPCLCGPLKKEAQTVIKNIASAKKIEFKQLNSKFKIIKRDYKNLQTVFSFGGESFKLKLAGAAQAQNAALVCLAAQTLGLHKEALDKAFLNIQMPCRFQVLPLGKRFLIKDGAHNPAAVKEFLNTYLASPFYSPNNTLIYAAMADKDYKTALKMLSPHFNHIVLTCADTKKGVPVNDLKVLFSDKKDIKTAEKPSAINLKKLSGNIVVAGSFYLCAQII